MRQSCVAGSQGSKIGIGLLRGMAYCGHLSAQVYGRGQIALFSQHEHLFETNMNSLKKKYCWLASCVSLHSLWLVAVGGTEQVNTLERKIGSIKQTSSHE